MAKPPTTFLGLKSVLINGEVLETQAINSEQFSANLTQLNLSEYGRKFMKPYFLAAKHYAPLVLSSLPQLNRFLTGYDLKNVFNEDESQFNLTRILTGY